MNYKVVLSDKALRTLKKMDRATSAAIISWIDKNLDGSEDPRRTGKALTGDLAGVWRYRVGDFRIFAKIEDDKLIILILEVRNRRKHTADRHTRFFQESN